MKTIRMMVLWAVGAALLLGLSPRADAADGKGEGEGEKQSGPRFVVRLDPALEIPDGTPVSGRLVVYLIRSGSSLFENARVQPGDAPFFEDPQPCFGVDVLGLVPGAEGGVVVDDRATAYPVPLSQLPGGSYKVQAVLDRTRDNSEWKREPGNLYSKTAVVEIGAAGGQAGGKTGGTVEITLTEMTKPRVPAPVDGAEIFSTRSELLSAFHGREIVMKAGVVKPIGWEEGRSYASVYEIPGFGGDSRTALMIARGRSPDRVKGLPQAEYELWSHAFRIVLDPESGTGNGHTLFVDSENNGPWARALVEELIPALEAKFNLIKRPEARLIAGHSSGGWSSLWLQVTHPDFFGGAWPSAPDPVDFRAFQRTDIYAAASMYELPDGSGPLPSYVTQAGETRMTVRTENLIEEVLGPRNTSGQQWDSWLAVFAPRGPDGLPADLFHPKTGLLDRTVAEAMRKYDIGEMLRREPEKVGRVLREKVRLIVGERDNYGLHLAVKLLKEDLDRLSPARPPDEGGGEGDAGYIKILPGDHGTVMMNPEARNARAEMLEQLKSSGVLER